MSVNPTVPTRPLMNAIVTLDLAEAPTFIADGWVASRVKSGGTPNVNETVVT